jgi:integration host factor subunit alpha
MTFLASGFRRTSERLLEPVAELDLFEMVSRPHVELQIQRREESVLGSITEAKNSRANGRTVTRADLAEVAYHRAGLSRTESAELVRSLIDEICDAVERGETVKLACFGSFVVRSKGQRIGRNPKTGVKALIVARRIMIFKPSRVFKARINAGSAIGRESDSRIDSCGATPPQRDQLPGKGS